MTPYIPVLSDVLYESVYESQHWILYDANKMRVACGDAIHTENYKATLAKGDYVLKLQVPSLYFQNSLLWVKTLTPQIRHDDTALLDKLKDQLLTLERPLKVIS